MKSLNAVAALVFIASVAVTAVWCGSMAMPGMEMPGGWTMSMAWMRMPGQTWLDAAVMFVGMWSVMMVAMMMPALSPMLSSYRRALPHRGSSFTVVVGLGYFTVWSLCGLLLFPLGAAFCELAMRATAVATVTPALAALVVLLAGASQFTSWKARQLAGCRHTVDCCRDTRPNYRAAWSHGLKIGLRCVRCCAGLTAALLVVGVMDLLAMALVTLAISAERLTPGGNAPRWVGAGLVVSGTWLLAAALSG